MSNIAFKYYTRLNKSINLQCKLIRQIQFDRRNKRENEKEKKRMEYLNFQLNAFQNNGIMASNTIMVKNPSDNKRRNQLPQCHELFKKYFFISKNDCINLHQPTDWIKHGASFVALVVE